MIDRENIYETWLTGRHGRSAVTLIINKLEEVVEASLREIQDELGQHGISYHTTRDVMKKLSDKGIVDRSHRARETFFRISSEYRVKD